MESQEWNIFSVSYKQLDYTDTWFRIPYYWRLCESNKIAMRKRQVICEKGLPRLLNHVFSGIIRWMKQNDLQKYFFYDSLIVMAVQLWLVRRPSTSKITPKILALTKGCDDEHLIKYRFQECLFLSVYKFFWPKRWTRTCIQNPNSRSSQIWHIMTFFVYYGWTQHSRINFACRRQPFNSLENSHWKKLVVPWV